MKDATRRKLLMSLPLAALPSEAMLGLFSSLSAAAQQAPAGTSQAPSGPPGKSQNALQTDLSHCKAFPFDTLPLRYSDGGAPTHDILRGTVPTGELIELHETTIAPGKMPHPPHQHPHEELILVREGTVDFTYGGQSHLLAAGSVGYTAPNEMHGFKNVGTVPATYFIFSLSKKY